MLTSSPIAEEHNIDTFVVNFSTLRSCLVPSELFSNGLDRPALHDTFWKQQSCSLDEWMSNYH